MLPTAPSASIDPLSLPVVSLAWTFPRPSGRGFFCPMGAAYFCH